MRLSHVKLAVCSTLLVLAACETTPIETVDVPPRVSVVAGDAISDTVQAGLTQLLETEVLGRNGKPAARLAVRFEVLTHTDPNRAPDAFVSVCTASSNVCADNSRLHTVTTDAKGRVQARVRLGTIAGGGRVQISVPEYGIADTATYTMLPGSAVKLRAQIADTTLEIGTTIPLRARLLDRFDNPLGEAPSVSAGAGDAFRVNGSAGTITATELGLQWLYWRYSSFSDSTRVRVLPPGRLVVWTGTEIRMINLDGKAERTVLKGVNSRLGVFPRFDATRQRITLHTGREYYDTPNRAVIIDTSGQSGREYNALQGFEAVTAVRQIADGTMIVVGRRVSDGPGYWIYRIDTDDSIRIITGVPGLVLSPQGYGGADISSDGKRLAYLNSLELRVLDLTTGAITILSPNARSPRWSPQGDRVAYLIPNAYGRSEYNGVPAVVNADGTGRVTLHDDEVSPGIAWSPDGKYVLVAPIVGGFRIIRVATLTSLYQQYFYGPGLINWYYQPDWR